MKPLKIIIKGLFIFLIYTWNIFLILLEVAFTSCIILSWVAMTSVMAIVDCFVMLYTWAFDAYDRKLFPVTKWLWEPIIDDLCWSVDEYWDRFTLHKKKK